MRSIPTWGAFPGHARRDRQSEATKVYDPFFGTTTAATHMLVEIDPETYKVGIGKHIVVEDSWVINPMIADGQAHGGVAQGIGVALMEEAVHDDNGRF